MAARRERRGGEGVNLDGPRRLANSRGGVSRGARMRWGSSRGSWPPTDAPLPRRWGRVGAPRTLHPLRCSVEAPPGPRGSGVGKMRSGGRDERRPSRRTAAPGGRPGPGLSGGSVEEGARTARSAHVLGRSQRFVIFAPRAGFLAALDGRQAAWGASRSGSSDEVTVLASLLVSAQERELLEREGEVTLEPSLRHLHEPEDLVGVGVAALKRVGAAAV